MRQWSSKQAEGPVEGVSRRRQLLHSLLHGPHVLQANQYPRTEDVWQTKMDTYIQRNAFAGQMYLDYADNLLAGAKRTKRHPGHP